MDPNTGVTWADTEWYEPTRFIALSDGLFATVLTILVLDLKLPGLAQAAGTSSLRAVLLDLWPHLFGYVITFLVAGLYWLAHHRACGYIVRTNLTFLWNNLMFLLFVGLFPFSTAGLGDHFSPLTWSIYALDMAAAGAMLFLIWGYASSHGLVDPQVPTGFRRYLGMRYLITPGLFLVSIGVEYALPQTSLAAWLLLLSPVLQGLLDRLYRHPQRPSAPVRPRLRVWGWRLVGLWPLLVFIALTVWLYSVSAP